MATQELIPQTANTDSAAFVTTTVTISTDIAYIRGNTGAQYLYAIDGSWYTIVVEATKTIEGDLDVADLTFSSQASVVTMMGPFPPDVFNDGNGDVKVTVSAGGGTDVSMGAIAFSRGC